MNPFMKNHIKNLFLLPSLIAGLIFIPTGRATAQAFTTLYNFEYTDDGGNPQAGLVISGNTLYGATDSGGSSGNGTVFAVNTNGTGLTTLHSFTVTSGSYSTNGDGNGPDGTLLLSGNTLYGTAYYGGTNGNGTIFALNTNGTVLPPCIVFRQAPVLFLTIIPTATEHVRKPD